MCRGKNNVLAESILLAMAIKETPTNEVGGVSTFIFNFTLKVEKIFFWEVYTDCIAY